MKHISYYLLGLLVLLTACHVTVTSSDPKPIATVSATSLDFGDGTTATFTIRNEGATGSTLDWNASISEPKKDGQAQNSAWFTLNPSSGREAKGEATPITLTLREGLASGDYTGAVVISYGGGSKSVQVRKTITATQPIPSVVLQGERDNIFLGINDTPSAEVRYNISLSDARYEGQPTREWLTITPSQGLISADTYTIINMLTNTPLAEGNYEAVLSLSFSSDDPNVAARWENRKYVVKFTANTPAVPVLPSDPVTFGDDVSKAVVIGNSAQGSAAMPYQVNVEYKQPTTAWFTISPSQGEVAGGTNETLTLTMAENLSAGDYSAIVTITAAGQRQSFNVNTTLAEGELFVPTTPLSLASTGKASFSLQNTGAADSVLQFRMASRDNSRDGDAIPQWYDVEPQEGSIRGGSSSAITLTLNSNSSAAGFYRSVLCVKYGANFASETCFLVTFDKVADQSEGDFSLAYDQNNYAIPPVDSNVEIRNIPIEIVRTENFASAVTFSISVEPDASISATFNPDAATSNRSYMTLSVDKNVAAGDYTITVTGKADRREHSVEVPLTIKSNEPANFSLSLKDTRLNVEAGESTQSTVTVSKVGNFNDTVRFSSVSIPQGISVSFSPNPSRTTSTITLQTNNNMEAGTYPVRIRGVSGTLAHDVLLNLTVTTSDPEDARIQGIVSTANDVRNFQVPLVGGGNSSLANQAIQPLPNQDFVAQQVLVKYKDDFIALASGERTLQLQARASSLQEDYGLTLRSQGLMSRGAQTMPDLLETTGSVDVLELVAQLEQDPRVEYAEPNYYIYLQSIPSDPDYSKEWHLPYTGVPVAWQAKTGSSNRVIAVIDSGIDTSHSDFAANTFVTGRDFCGDNTCKSDGDVSPEIDSDNHGTHVAGIIAASGNQQGIAGVLATRARILPVKVFYQGNFTTANALANAVRWAAGLNVAGVPQNSNPADVINLSLGTSQDAQVLREAIEAASRAGSLLIAAAGNYGRSSLLYPAAYDDVMAVGSVNSSFQRSCFSHTGAGLDIVAPGGDYDISRIVQGVSCPSNTKPEAILSTIPANNYGLLFGTSQATPIVSGIAALVWQHNAGFSASQVRNRLKQSAYKASYMDSNAYGAGIVRADAALGLASIGDTITVTANGQRNGDSASDTVTLNRRGTSDSFSLDTLVADRYVLKASSDDDASFSASSSVTLTASQNVTDVELVLSVE